MATIKKAVAPAKKAAVKPAPNKTKTSLPEVTAEMLQPLPGPTEEQIMQWELETKELQDKRLLQQCIMAAFPAVIRVSNGNSVMIADLSVAHGKALFEKLQKI